jgi:hypothetical protein
MSGARTSNDTLSKIAIYNFVKITLKPPIAGYFVETIS